MKIDDKYNIDFIHLCQSEKIQLQFATNRIKICPLKPEIQPAKGCVHHYARAVMSRDVIGLPQVTISLVIFFFLLWKYICKTHKSFQTLSYHTDVVRAGSLS